MDDDEQQRREAASNRRGKAKFVPKAPTRTRRKPKAEVEENISAEDAAAQAQELMARFTNNLTRKGPKSESQAQPQVAIGPGALTTPSIRKFEVPRNKNILTRSVMKDSMDVDNDSGGTLTSSSTIKEGVAVYPSVLDDGSFLKGRPKVYKEPWDYQGSYYPTTLPLRKPPSGDPELLNEAEFGEAARNVEYDENTIKPSKDLGLLEKESDTKKMILLQLPPSLPIQKRSASAKGKESAESSTSSARKEVSEGGGLEALSEGYVGKMLVYKSGAVKLKLGGVLYDVTPGSGYTFAQEVMAINTAAKHCCSIGEIDQRAVVTPDVDFLLNSVIDLD